MSCAYSPGITKNLISVGFLADKGFSLEFMKNKCIIKNSGGYFVGLAHKNHTNGLYKLQGVTLMGCYEVPIHAPKVHSLSCADSSKAALWHRRLGHYHFQGIRRMMQLRDFQRWLLATFHALHAFLGNKARSPFQR